MVSVSASRATPSRAYRSGSGVMFSGFVEDAGDVTGDRTDRRHGPGVVHAGGADHAEVAHGLFAWPVTGRDDARGRELLVGTLVTDAHGHRAAGLGLAQQLEQDDVFLERFEERPD